MQTAQILWKTDDFGNTVPTSTAFDDVYFSHAHGLSESCYVFGDGNGLTQRFANALKNNENFTICETGFGTGLNFLMACELWATLASQYPNSTARLHFISTEKFPLNHNDLQKALEVWQGSEILSLFINELIDNYPFAIIGCHRRNFRHNISLDLWLGDASDSLTTLAHQPHAPKVHAWFLDGFAPAKNSELWSPAIFDAIATLSTTGTTLATFTSAGTVKRELIRIGARVKKIKGFGRKREMLTAYFDTAFDTNNKLKSWHNLHGRIAIRPYEPNVNFAPFLKFYPVHFKPTTPKTALIIGCGIAGLMSAYALAVRGVKVTIIDKTAPLAGASGNPKALFSPKLTDISTAQTNLSLISFLYAHHLYDKFNKLSDNEILSQTGVLDFMLPTQKSNDKLRSLIAPYPADFIQECLDKAVDGVFSDDFTLKFKAMLPSAGLIDTHQLAQFVLSQPNIRFKQGEIINLQTPCFDGVDYDVAVICAGFESHLVNGTIFNCRKIRGQVSWLNDDTIINKFNTLQASVKYDGYACAFDGTFLFGASFVRNDTKTDIRLDEHAFNLDKLSSALPSLANTIKINDLQGRSSIRGQTPDYHPIVGQIGERMFVNTGYGSKGYSFAPLCGELIAGLMFDECLPISNELFAKLSPLRVRLQTPIDENF